MTVNPAQLYKDLGRTLHRAKGGILRCRSCGVEEDLAEDQIRDHLASGWPVCCNETMEWVTARQLAMEALRDR